jgi:flagellar protein FliO/FliZ
MLAFFAITAFNQDIQLNAQEAEPIEVLPETELVLGEDAPGVISSGGPSIFTVLRMVLVLALVAAAVYGVVFFMRRAGRPQDQRNSHLKILTSAHLGSNRYVYAVSIGSHAWLVGAGEGGISLIAEITEQEAIDVLLLEESRKHIESPGARLPDFQAVLRRIGGKPPPKPPENGDVSPESPDPSRPLSADSVRKRRERLKGL